MKKSIKNLSLFLLMVVTLFIGGKQVFASTAPKSFKATSYQMTPAPLGLTEKVNIKKTTDGKYIYCYDVNKKVPVGGVEYNYIGYFDNPAIGYIVVSGLYDKTDSEFFATQTALWIYLIDNGYMKDTASGYVAKIKAKVYSTAYQNDPIVKDIKNILENAKKAKYEKPRLNMDDKVTFTLKDGTFVSNLINVDTNTEWDVKFTNAPKGTTYTKVGNGFIVSIPESSISYGRVVDFNIEVEGTITYGAAFKYAAKDTSYQLMLYGSTATETRSATAKATVYRRNVPMEPTTIIISKQDATTSKELPGATLIVRDSNGKEVERWVSTDKPHYIYNLSAGTYTLEEIIAPKGYKLTSEKKTFTVANDNSEKKVVMYNSPEELKETVVSISKKDVTTKEELPGATLIIRNSKGEIAKDSNGNELKWVSTNEPKIIKGLEEGTYTLEEQIAPNGYKLSSEKITFEVKNNGVVTEVVMFNTPESTEIIVPSTSAFTSNLTYIIGGLVIIIGSVLLYRNVKKEQ